MPDTDIHLCAGDTVTFNDPAWIECHGGLSEFSSRVGVLTSSHRRSGMGLTWLVYYADENFTYGIHESWLLSIFIIQELP